MSAGSRMETITTMMTIPFHPIPQTAPRYFGSCCCRMGWIQFMVNVLVTSSKEAFLSDVVWQIMRMSSSMCFRKLLGESKVERMLTVRTQSPFSVTVSSPFSWTNPDVEGFWGESFKGAGLLRPSSFFSVNNPWRWTGILMVSNAWKSWSEYMWLALLISATWVIKKTCNSHLCSQKACTQQGQNHPDFVKTFRCVEPWPNGIPNSSQAFILDGVGYHLATHLTGVVLSWLEFDQAQFFAQRKPSFPLFSYLGQLEPSYLVILRWLRSHSQTIKQFSCELAQLGSAVWPPTNASYDFVTWLELVVPFCQG